jgi:hypothetical protein
MNRKLPPDTKSHKQAFLAGYRAASKRIEKKSTARMEKTSAECAWNAYRLPEDPLLCAACGSKRDRAQTVELVWDDSVFKFCSDQCRDGFVEHHRNRRRQ